MIRLVLACSVSTGCWQMTIYAGPRADPAGRIGVELGASMGAAVRPARGRAVVASIDSSVESGPAECPASGCVAARRISGDDGPTSHGAIRGVLELTERPPANHLAFERAPGTGWRFGVYGGAEIANTATGTRTVTPLVGAIMTMSPWVWAYDGVDNEQSIALGLQIAVETDPFDRRQLIVRGALACDLQFLPKR